MNKINVLDIDLCDSVLLNGIPTFILSIEIDFKLNFIVFNETIKLPFDSDVPLIEKDYMRRFPANLKPSTGGCIQ